MSLPSIQSVAIVGAGAIGGWLGVHLARAGCQVSALARGETLNTLRSHGLRLHQGGELLQVPVDASDRAYQLGAHDLVVLAVKAPALPGIAPVIGPLIARHTVVLTAMNGVPWWFFEGFGGALKGTPLPVVDPGGAMARAVPARHILGGVVHASCSTDGPGIVRHHFGNGLIVGEPSGEQSPRAQAVVACLREAGIDATLSAQIQRDIWFKLWGNMTVNPVSALTGATTDRILADPQVRDFISAVMREAKAIGEKIGIPIAQAPEDRHAVTLKLGAFRTSMLQDVEARRPVELDALVSAVRELGRLTQVPTPFTDALLGLARLQARTLGLYPEPPSAGQQG
ncbi:2-dehydropantoate 2-reductase [Hydrogenophaga sp. XSHU_21]